MKAYFHQISAFLQDAFNHQLDDIVNKVQSINPLINVAKIENDVVKILSLRQKVYPTCFPESDVDNLDAHDYRSLLFFTEDGDGCITSTCRLVLDSDIGLVEETIYKPYIDEYRAQGQKLAEWGRCIVTKESLVSATDYHVTIKHISNFLNIQKILIFNRQNDVPKVLSKINAEVLIQTDKTFGSQDKFTAIMWTLPDTDKPTDRKIYDTDIWDTYSRSFMTITTSYQVAVLHKASEYLSGNVVDCGAGCAKIAPYLSIKDNVDSYTAIDASSSMCILGNQVLERLNNNTFQTVTCHIEDFNNPYQYDSAVSINSLYTWSNPVVVLSHIYSMLRANAILVLASINKDIDIPLMVTKLTPELLMHPDADAFREMNIKIGNNTQAHRYTLNELIKLVHSIGFQIIECHDDVFFEGGLNFMVLKKPDNN